MIHLNLHFEHLHDFVQYTRQFDTRERLNIIQQMDKSLLRSLVVQYAHHYDVRPIDLLRDLYEDMLELDLNSLVNNPQYFPPELYRGL